MALRPQPAGGGLGGLRLTLETRQTAHRPHSAGSGHEHGPTLGFLLLNCETKGWAWEEGTLDVDTTAGSLVEVVTRGLHSGPLNGRRQGCGRGPGCHSLL